jgi:hypothetical protein
VIEKVFGWIKQWVGLRQFKLLSPEVEAALTASCPEVWPGRIKKLLKLPKRAKSVRQSVLKRLITIASARQKHRQHRVRRQF